MKVFPYRGPLLLVLSWSAAGCDGAPPTGSPATPAAAPAAFFEDVAAVTGLEFRHENGRTGDLHLAEITCGGVGLFDFDGDGDQDVFLPQGSRFGARGPLPSEGVVRDRLFRNELGTGMEAGSVMRFVDRTATSGIDGREYGCGAAVGDVDGDGFDDLYVLNLGANRLWRNRGDGTFEDVTEAAGVGDPGNSVAGSFFDADGDGDLDLFVGNNVEFLYDPPPRCHDLTGAPDYCGPGAYPAQADRFYRNLGDGRFQDATAALGLEARPMPTLGVVAADFDDDGWTDVYVANDGQPNRLWRNRDGQGFEDVALMRGAAVNSVGESEASMGVDAGDVDGDGDLDLVAVHLIKETNTFYRNEGDGSFVDASTVSGMGTASLPYTSFGAGFLDVDRDGFLDLLVVNGAVTNLPALVEAGDPFPLHQRDQLWVHRREGGWTEIATAAEPALAVSRVSRGLAIGDLDRDGDADAVVVDSGAPVRLLRGLGSASTGWLGVDLRTSGRVAIGGRIDVEREPPDRISRRVRVDGSFASAQDAVVLVGLGDRSAARLSASVPGRRVIRFVRPPAGSFLRIDLPSEPAS